MLSNTVIYLNKPLQKNENNNKEKISNNCLCVMSELRKALINDNISHDCISLYDLLNVIRKRNSEFEKMYHNFIKKINNKLKQSSNYKKHISFEFKRFNFDSMELTIKCKDYKYCEDMIVGKKDGFLYIKGFCPSMSAEIQSDCWKLISNFYDDCIKYKDIIEPCNIAVDIEDLAFNIHISRTAMYIGDTMTSEIFGLSSRIDSENYYYYCESGELVELFKGNEEEFLSKMYVKIDNCHKNNNCACF